MDDDDDDTWVLGPQHRQRNIAASCTNPSINGRRIDTSSTSNGAIGEDVMRGEEERKEKSQRNDAATKGKKEPAEARGQVTKTLFTQNRKSRTRKKTSAADATKRIVNREREREREREMETDEGEEKEGRQGDALTKTRRMEGEGPVWQLLAQIRRCRAFFYIIIHLSEALTLSFFLFFSSPLVVLEKNSWLRRHAALE